MKLNLKRIVLLIICIVLATLVIFRLNQDNGVKNPTNKDVAYLKCCVIGDYELTESEKILYDYNCDGEITVVDYAICKKIIRENSLDFAINLYGYSKEVK